MQTGGIMTLKIQSRNTTTTLSTRRPTLIRVWRTEGTRLASTWVPTLAPSTRLNDEGGPRL
jgi:hypothetical protein